MTVGERLREAREAQSMTIGDIARRTFIQPKFLQAIEEGNFGMIPGPQRRFFVRDYARVVGLDPDSLIAEIPDAPPPPTTIPEPMTSGGWTPPEPPPDAERRRRDRFKPMAFGDDRRRSTNMVNWVIAAAVVLLLLVGGYLLFKDDLSDSGPKGQNRPTATDNSGSPTEIISAPGDDSAGATIDSTSNVGDSLTLIGTATAQVWFSIVMDGGPSETGTLDSGTVKTWRAMNTFKLSLGNAGGLELTLNDKPLGTLGPRRTIIRDQVIDANGVRRKPARHLPVGESQNRNSAPRQITPTETRSPSLRPSGSAPQINTQRRSP